MPSTVVEVRHSYPPDQEVRIVEAVHAALVKGFKIPEEDRCVRLITYAPHLFICSPKHEHPERYTVVTVTAFSGRSLEAKRNLYQGIVEGLEELGIPRSHVKIILNEVPKENWGLRGGKPASEIELGFKVEV
ncbi:tautomerase family protein [Roseateles sp. P5_E7]